jgi:hypothetical protein
LIKWKEGRISAAFNVFLRARNNYLPSTAQRPEFLSGRILRILYPGTNSLPAPAPPSSASNRTSLFRTGQPRPHPRFLLCPPRTRKQPTNSDEPSRSSTSAHGCSVKVEYVFTLRRGLPLQSTASSSAAPATTPAWHLHDVILVVQPCAVPLP